MIQIQVGYFFEIFKVFLGECFQNGNFFFIEIFIFWFGLNFSKLSIHNVDYLLVGELLHIDDFGFVEVDVLMGNQQKTDTRHRIVPFYIALELLNLIRSQAIQLDDTFMCISRFFL